MKTINYGNETDFLNATNDLELFTKVPVFAQINDSVSVQCENKSAIIGQDGRVINVLGDDYGLLQHKEAFSIICDALKRLNLEHTGRIRNYGEIAEMNVLFNGMKLDDQEKGIALGFRVVNSVNGFKRLTVQPYAIRMICSNGMVLGDTVGISLEQKHTSKAVEVYAKSIRNLINQLSERSGQFQEFINNSMKDSLEWEMVQKIINTMAKKKEFRAEIERRLIGKQLTRWEVYNAVTNFCTHSGMLSWDYEDTIQNKACQLLEGTLEIKERKPRASFQEGML